MAPSLSSAGRVLDMQEAFAVGLEEQRRIDQLQTVARSNSRKELEAKLGMHDMEAYKSTLRACRMERSALQEEGRRIDEEMGGLEEACERLRERCTALENDREAVALLNATKSQGAAALRVKETAEERNLELSLLVEEISKMETGLVRREARLSEEADRLEELLRGERARLGALNPSSLRSRSELQVELACLTAQHEKMLVDRRVKIDAAAEEVQRAQAEHDVLSSRLAVLDSDCDDLLDGAERWERKILQEEHRLRMVEAGLVRAWESLVDDASGRCLARGLWRLGKVRAEGGRSVLPAGAATEAILGVLPPLAEHGVLRETIAHAILEESGASAAQDLEGAGLDDNAFDAVVERVLPDLRARFLESLAPPGKDE